MIIELWGGPADGTVVEVPARPAGREWRVPMLGDPVPFRSDEPRCEVGEGGAVYRQTTWIRRGRLVYRYRGQVP